MLSAAKHLRSRHANRWETEMLRCAQHDMAGLSIVVVHIHHRVSTRLRSLFLIEKPANDGKQQVGAGENVQVIGAGKDGELGSRGFAFCAAEQAEHLYKVIEP